MSQYENGLYSYIEGRLMPLERAGKCYFFRNNSFSGRIMRYDGSQGFIKNNKRGTPDVVACFYTEEQQDNADQFMGDFFTSFGLFVGFELKTKTGRQSPEQKLAQKAIEDAGGKYYIIRTPEEFEEVLKELCG